MKRSVKIIIGIFICLFLIGCENNKELTKEEQIKINYGQIDSEILRKNFKDINNTHELNFASLDNEILKINYEKDIIEIESITNIKNNQIYFYETYNTNTKKLDNLKIYMPNDNNDIIKEIVTKISLMPGLNLSTKDAYTLEKYLIDSLPTVDNCQNIGDFCISKTKTDLLDAYNIKRQ